MNVMPSILKLVCVMLFFFAACRLGAAPPRKKVTGAIDVAAMLWAIRQVESGDNPFVVGALGERSAYQFLQSTWVEYTNVNFVGGASCDSPLVRAIAERHLNRICARLFSNGRPADPAIIAAAWRYGIANGVRCCRKDSARRTANLYWYKVGGGR